MNEDNAHFEPDFRFTDVTILEANGQYDEVCDIMRAEPFPWCLRTHLTLIHPFGVSEMELELHSDRRVVIVDFKPSIRDPLLNCDLRCLRAWTEANGWSIAEPHRNILDSGIAFWRHQWTVNAIVSPELDSRYGKREDLEEQAKNVRRDDWQEEAV